MGFFFWLPVALSLRTAVVEVQRPARLPQMPDRLATREMALH